MRIEELPKRAGGESRMGGRIRGHVTVGARKKETVSKDGERRGEILTLGSWKPIKSWASGSSRSLPGLEPAKQSRISGGESVWEENI